MPSIPETKNSRSAHPGVLENTIRSPAAVKIISAIAQSISLWKCGRMKKNAANTGSA